MNNQQNSASKAIDQANDQINAMANIDSTETYMASLNKQQQGTYLVRPDGSVEFIK